jgi:pyruvate,water dikinase
VSGPVRILTSPDQVDQLRDGDILVAATTSPDWMPLLRRAAALVTDGGGITCHAAIVSRELGIPAVVSTRTATHVLHDGQQVTVDGGRGVVEEGTASPADRVRTPAPVATAAARSGPSPLLYADPASKDRADR